MTENKDKAAGGIGFLGMLTILFIGLKLTGFISWPWLWVLAPMWIFPALFLAILGIGLTIVFIVKLFRKTSNAKE